MHMASELRRRACGIVAGAAFVFLCGVSSGVRAAPQMLFTQLGADENVSQGSILAIAQDSRGFLWFGTEDGLNRYDGYDVDHITHDREASASLPNNWVSALTQDRQGRLWIGTAGGGVVWRDPASGQFHLPNTADGKALVDPHADVRVLFFDRRERLWIGTRTTGVRVVDLRTGESRDYSRDLTDSGSLGDDSVLAICEDAGGALWVATSAGVDRIDPNSGQVTRLDERLRTLARPKVDKLAVRALRIDARGTIWMGSDVGLIRFDPVSDSLQLLRHRDDDATSLPDDRVSSIFEDDGQRLWIGTDGGLALLDRRTDRFTTFRNEATDRASLPDNHVVTLFQDRSGLLWVGTKSGGLARWNPRTWSFGHERLGSGDGDNVTSFAEDRHGVLWVGTLGGGIAAVNRATGRLSRYRHNPRNGSSLGDDNVMALIVDEADRVWIGTMQAGVERLDPHTGQPMAAA
jgi:two-component system sensor histidine kinase ChiS